MNTPSESPIDPSDESNKQSPAAGSERTSGAPAGADSSAAGQVDTADAPADEDELPESEPLTPEIMEEEAIRGDFMIRWAVVLLALLFGCTEIPETSTLVHVKTGQYLMSHGILPPRADVFSYTVGGDRTWVNLSWLFDLLLGLTYTVAGATGITLLKAVLVAVAIYLVVGTSRRGVSTWWGSIAAATALLVSYSQLTALPEVVTLLGIALVLWMLHRWREQGDARLAGKLAVVFVLWSNLDPRMFLGLAVVLLYAVGHTVGRILSHEAALKSQQFKQLWIAAGCCLAASLVNPFGWHSLLAPVSLYGVEYPAWRSATLATLAADRLQYFPITSGTFWTHVSYHVLAGLMLGAIALVALALDWDDVDWGQVVVFLGFAGLAMASARELPAASIVFAVVCTLHLQHWYRQRFRQAYSVSTSEIVFSRGGRAATVVVLFVMAYLSLNGSISGRQTRRAGFGWDRVLQAQLAGIADETSDAFDDKPFNFLIEQGDMLIWNDQRVFVDSRLALYAAPGTENILALHETIRAALRPAVLEPTNRQAAAEAAKQKMDANQKLQREIFDRFNVTHLLPFLADAYRANYETYLTLLQSPDSWQQCYLGAITAGFYRKDLVAADSPLKAENRPEYEKYLETHKIDFSKAAFRTGADKPGIRPEWAQAKSSYVRLLSRPDRSLPNRIQRAQHYAMFLNYRGLRFGPDLGLALAHLAIQDANAGLVDEPQCVNGYRVLGIAYEYLMNTEAQIAGTMPAALLSQRRKLQAIHAYSQAVLLDPKHSGTKMKLVYLYLNAGHYDLARRELDEYSQLVNSGEVGEQGLKELAEVQKAQKRLDEIIDRVSLQKDNIILQTKNPMQAAVFAQQAGCSLLALKVLEEDPELLARDLSAQLFRALLLMESGATQRANDALESLQPVAESYQNTQWRAPTALAILGNGQYESAIELWARDARDDRQNGTSALLRSLPLAGSLANWPFGHAAACYTSLYATPEVYAERLMQIALCHLELGQPKEAAKVLKRIVDYYPETSLRTLVRFYLFQTTQELIELVPASDRIPVAPDLFAPAAKSDASKHAEKTDVTGSPVVAPKPTK